MKWFKNQQSVFFRVSFLSATSPLLLTRFIKNAPKEVIKLKVIIVFFQIAQNVYSKHSIVENVVKNG